MPGPGCWGCGLRKPGRLDQDPSGLLDGQEDQEGQVGTGSCSIHQDPSAVGNRGRREDTTAGAADHIDRACHRNRRVQEDQHVPIRQPCVEGSIRHTQGHPEAVLAGWACPEDRGHGWDPGRGVQAVPEGLVPRFRVEDEPDSKVFVSTESETVMMSKEFEDDV